MTQESTRERSKQLGVAVAVLAVLVVGTFALSYVFQPKDNTLERGQIEPAANGFLGERAGSLDVLFVGDSRVYSTFSPLQMWHEFGFASYDAASPGQNLPYANTLLKRCFSEQSPRVVVFETDSFNLEFALGDGVFRMVEDVVPLFEYHTRWKNVTLADVTEPVRTTWTDEFKAFRIDNNSTPADVSTYALPTDAIEAVPGNNQRWLRLMVEYCREHDAVPVFMSVPSTKNWDMAKHNGIQALADELGVTYLDLNLMQDQLHIDWQNESLDWGEHLNYRGAVKVSHLVGEYLSATYGLSDHRGEVEYASWDEAYKNYEEQVRLLT